MRAIKWVHEAPITQLGDHKIRQAFPLRDLEEVGPFILLHHFRMEVAPFEFDFEVPPHPHRGFCPITFMFDGSIEHKDSLGNHAVIGAHEVQWITAGRGIIHSEKAPKSFVEQGGLFQGIQLWVNLPRAEKMNAPSYQPLTAKEIPTIANAQGTLYLVSGTYQDQRGPAPHTAFMAMLELNTDGEFTFEFPADHEVAVYVLEGRVKCNTSHIEEAHHLLTFKQEAGSITLQAMGQSARLLVLAGAPILEPRVSHGPFVMTTQTEILEAMRDYQQGKMGFLY